MKLNRALSAIVLTGLLSGAAMVAQAQTRIMVRIGTPVAEVAVNYAPPCPGPGYEWVAGYYNGPQWIPGQWVYRVDSRYQREDRYSGRYVQFDNRGRDNRDANYRNTDQNRNGYANHNDRNSRYNGRDNRGGRH